MSTKIAVIGGGASALFLLKAFVKIANKNFSLHIFEAESRIAIGMPYSSRWNNPEHEVNIACQELPVLCEGPVTWLRNLPDSVLNKYRIDRSRIGRLFMFPRVLLGDYFEDQFLILLNQAKEKGLDVFVHTNSRVTDIEDIPQKNRVRIRINEKRWQTFNHVIIATGHAWPKYNEGRIDGYYDSPFPLNKLNSIHNQEIGIMGTSLSAIDAIKTLARNHGSFEYNNEGTLEYQANMGTENFRIVMHSRRGLLPSIRFFFEHPRLKKYLYVSKSKIKRNIKSNDGYLSLDFVFNESYKSTLAEGDSEHYSIIKDLSIEEFAQYYYGIFQNDQPFDLFQRNLEIHKQSQQNKIPIIWKEAIDDTFYTLNFHAKSLCAEDMIRLRNCLMPLAYHDGAFLPFDSCEELLALHRARKLDLIRLGEKSIEFKYQIFVDCRGQRHMPFEDFPFKTLISQGAVSPARVKFLSNHVERYMGNLPAGCSIEFIDNNYFLKLPGIAFNDNFQIIDSQGNCNQKIYVIANAYIKGMNPDFSGLPFCNDSAKIILKSITKFNRIAARV